jgi:uncharacterized protein YraI
MRSSGGLTLLALIGLVMVYNHDWDTADAIAPPVTDAPLISNTQSDRDDAPIARAASAEKTNEVVYVTASALRMREGPGTKYPIIESVPNGTRLTVIEANASGWTLAKSSISGNQGWMASRYLSTAELPMSKSVPSQVMTRRPPRNSDPPQTQVSRLSDSQIRKKIIRDSISSYPGSCPCPYNVDRGGRRCGGRSAYSRPGGYAPLCYERDVSDAMVARFR